MTNAIQPYEALKTLALAEDTQERFIAMLGPKRGPAFTISLLNIASQDEGRLLECSPKTIIRSALNLAALDLPIDPSLGMAAIVPYSSFTLGDSLRQAPQNVEKISTTRALPAIAERSNGLSGGTPR